MTLYDFKDHPDHQARLGEWADKWIANAMSTAPADQTAMRSAMTGLYDAANLEPPTRGVFVKSPMTAAIAGSIAAGVWWIRDNPGQHAKLFGHVVSEAELLAALRVACAVAVDRGMATLRGEEPRLPWPPAATEAATRDATGAATWDATGAATEAATRAATRAATEDATVINFLLQCPSGWYRMHDGGSDWSSYPAYLSFFDRVANLNLAVHDKWRHYEAAAANGASRMMHKRFWIVSDRQVSIHVDPQARLHHETGPARTWGDGWAIYAWHGVRVPADLIEDGWDTARILKEPNAEVRRCAIERLGWERFVVDAGLAQVGESVPDPGNPGHTLALYDVPEAIYDTAVRVLICDNATPERDGTRRRFGLTVPASMPDPVAAAAWTFGLNPSEYAALERAS